MQLSEEQQNVRNSYLALNGHVTACDTALFFSIKENRKGGGRKTRELFYILKRYQIRNPYLINYLTQYIIFLIYTYTRIFYICIIILREKNFFSFYLFSNSNFQLSVQNKLFASWPAADSNYIIGGQETCLFQQFILYMY